MTHREESPNTLSLCSPPGGRRPLQRLGHELRRPGRVPGRRDGDQADRRVAAAAAHTAAADAAAADAAAADAAATAAAANAYDHLHRDVGSY